MEFNSHRSRRIAELLVALASFLYLASGILALGPTLINDEYAALDYTYRVINSGQFFPTPDRLHKPLSLVFGLTAFFETPLAFEFITALFASLFAVHLFRFVHESLGFACAALSFLLIFTNPDMLYYTVTGNTVIPFAAFAFVAASASLHLENRPSLIWLYAFCFFLAGLLRPESWLFAGPLALYFLALRKKIGWWRIVIAICIIELAPVIWFGKDFFINNDILHGAHVSAALRPVSSGAPFTAWGAFRYFPIRISAKLSVPTFLLGLFGVALFLKDRGLRGILHPLILFPVVVIPYVWLIVWMVFPVQRYYYFLTVFALIFAASSWVWLFRAFRNKRSPLRWLALLGLIAFAVVHLFYLPVKFKKDMDELRGEARIQREMIKVAEYLDGYIPSGQNPLIMISARRNEQLSWLFRNREIPRVLTFRKAYYLEHYKGYDFLYLEPDLIVYLYDDYQFKGPREMFQWLKFQDHTTLRGVKIDLLFETPLIRVFKVRYPSDWPEPPPEPRIP